MNDIRDRLLALEESFGIRHVQYRSYLPGRLWIIAAYPELLRKALFACNIHGKPRCIGSDELLLNEVLEWQPNSLPKAGQWVRASRGLYKGDLALVLLASPDTDIIRIAVVPRLPPVIAAPPKKKRKVSPAAARSSKSKRPPPSFFVVASGFQRARESLPPVSDSSAQSPVDDSPTRANGEQRSMHEGEIRQEYTVEHEGATYIGGLLIKSVCGSAYHLEASPLKHEMVPFVDSRIWPDVVLPQFLVLHWKEGEKVTIHASPYLGARGTIADTKPEFAVVRLEDLESVGAVSPCIFTPYNDLHRRWDTGDVVKAIAGTDVGKIGIVVEVEHDPPYITFLEQGTLTSVSVAR